MAEKNGVPDQKSQDFKAKAKHWAIIGGLGLVGAFIIVSFVPRAWANFIGRIVNESWLTGILVGVAIGFVCTFVPYWLISTGWRKRSDGSSNIFLIMGLVFAIPNLITLWIVLLGSSKGSGAPDIALQRLNLDAPGFRLGSLLGAIGAVVLAVFLWNLQRQRDAAKAEAAKERELAQAKAAADDTTRVVDHSGSAGTTASGTGGAAPAGEAATNTDPPSHP